MDDMKALVERYKRELMEYSKQNPQPAAKPRPQPAEPPTPVEQERTPEVIGYSDKGDLMSAFSDMFTDIAPEKAPAAAEPPVSMQSSEMAADEFFPPQPDTDNTMQPAEPILPEAEEITEPATDKFMDLPQNYDSGVSTVTPEQAEELNDTPESGQFPSEQLGKRDFNEEREPAVNSREDIKPLVQSGSAPVIVMPTYNTLRDFTEANPRRGTVRFQTYTARGALPVTNAKIVVSKPIGGETHVFYNLTTDISGLTPIASLPAPPKELSEIPNSEITPYATYNALVTAKGYTDVQLQNIPVFEGILSVQRVALVPSAGTSPSEVITETEPDLNGGN